MTDCSVYGVFSSSDELRQFVGYVECLDVRSRFVLHPIAIYHLTLLGGLMNQACISDKSARSKERKYDMSVWRKFATSQRNILARIGT